MYPTAKILLHPTAALRPQTVADIEQATGRVVCVTDNGASLELVRPGVLAALNALEALYAVLPGL